MKTDRFVWVLLAVWLVGLGPGASPAHAESTMNCPSGTYDMLDWMTMDSDLRAQYHLEGSANPIYTTMDSGKFYWTKSGAGDPWDIQLYDDNYIYLWITELEWGNPSTFKEFADNTNMPLAPRCAKGGSPGSTVTSSNTTYQKHVSCSSYKNQSLGYAVNQVWGPYNISLGGSLPNNMPALVVSYRYNCDKTYNNCSDKEAYYLSQRYGLVQWIHYRLVNGTYEQQQKSVFNQLKSGTVVPNVPCS
jgi:hypothetical protein